MRIFVIFFVLLILLMIFMFVNNPLKDVNFNDMSFVPSPKFKDESSAHNFTLSLDNSLNSAHSSSLAHTKKGLMVVFFAGSREGATDVAIYRSFLSDEQSLKKPEKILDAKMLSEFSNKFIKKLGNPVIFTDLNSKTHLFVVGVSLGGWSTSKIYHLVFDENLQKLSFVRELKLGLFANFSHLVRNHPISLQEPNSGTNKGFILPIYHEFARKFPLLAYFDESGNFIYAKKINELKNQLQPSISALNEKEILLSFRSFNSYDNDIFLQKCDTKLTCDEPLRTKLKNYDNSNLLFSFYNSNNELRSFLIQNKSDDEKSRRKELALYYLNGSDFCELYVIDKGNEVSYPSIAIDDNSLYLSYTYNRKNIKVDVKTLAFIENMIKDKKCF